MQTQFQYIEDLTKQHRGFIENPISLYAAINSLPATVVYEIKKNQFVISID